jgi:hypothetical protein
MMGDHKGGFLGAEAQQMPVSNLRDDQSAAHKGKLRPRSPKKARVRACARGAHPGITTLGSF